MYIWWCPINFNVAITWFQWFPMCLNCILCLGMMMKKKKKEEDDDDDDDDDICHCHCHCNCYCYC